MVNKINIKLKCTAVAACMLNSSVLIDVTVEHNIQCGNKIFKFRHPSSNTLLQNMLNAVYVELRRRIMKFALQTS